MRKVKILCVSILLILNNKYVTELSLVLILV